MRRQVLAGIVAIVSLVLSISPAFADAKTIGITLDASADSFGSLKQKASSTAQSLVEKEFQQNPKTTEISVTISGDRNGQVAPILFSKMTRAQWQESSMVSRWAQYFDASEILLGFLTPQPQAPASAANPTNETVSASTNPTLVLPTPTLDREGRETEPERRDD